MRRIKNRLRINCTIFIYSIIWIIFNSCDTVSYESVEVSFLNQNDKIKLAGTISIPKVDKKVPAVLLIQGSGAHNRDEEILGYKPFETISNYFAGKGIAVLRVDRRGCGKSEGNYSSLDVNHFVDDALYGIKFLKSYPNIDTNKIGLIGHSLGGLIAPLAASQTNDVAFIISCAGPGIWGNDMLYSQDSLYAELSGAKPEDYKQIKRLCDRRFNLIMKDSITEKEINEFSEIYIKLSEYVTDDLRRMFFSIPANQAYSFFRAPQFKKAMEIDPVLAWENVKCPVLVINGSKDFQTAADINLEGINKGLSKGGNTRFKIIKLQNHNHLFQQTDYGNPIEYGKLKEPFSPVVLNLMTDWIISLNKK